MKNKKQILNVLENVKLFYTVQDGFDPSFLYQKRYGICWHVTANIDNTYIDYSDFYGAFVALGYHKMYPVEYQIQPDDPAFLYLNTQDLYDPQTEQGQLRLKLLDEMIEYFKK